jgi:RNA polymerase sigma-70 factor (ECF subfamily)
MADRSLDPTVITELFCRYQRGDEQAFTTLYRQLARPLLAYCLSFTPSTEGAYDLLHHTLALVVEKRSSFTHGNALAWIFTIARNAGRTLEVRERRQERVTDETDFDLAARKVGYDTAPQWDADELAIVTTAVGRLAEEFREVVYLFYYADMAVDEIADTIGITSNLVRVRLHRARAQLKPLLKPLMPNSHG